MKAPIEPTPAPVPTATVTSSPTAIPTIPTIPTPTQNPAPMVPFVYENLTLNITTGDTVIRVNDASPDEKLTIMSEQNLWSNTSAQLRWNYQLFNYTFTQPGIYGVYIMEEPRIRHQKIVVNP